MSSPADGGTAIDKMLIQYFFPKPSPVGSFAGKGPPCPPLVPAPGSRCPLPRAPGALLQGLCWAEQQTLAEVGRGHPVGSLVPPHTGCRTGQESTALPRSRLEEVRVRPLLFRETVFFLLKAKVKHGTGRRGQAQSSLVFTSIFRGLFLLGCCIGLLMKLGDWRGSSFPLSALALSNFAFPSAALCFAGVFMQPLGLKRCPCKAKSPPPSRENAAEQKPSPPSVLPPPRRGHISPGVC